MTSDPLLDGICRELVHRGAHTILLYGSRADGSSNEYSDYDVAGFAPIDRTSRDARVVDGQFLDVFLYPDGLLDKPSQELLTLRGGRILRQRDEQATRFLAGLDAVYEQGPEPLPADEVRARYVWAKKMVLRAQRGDLEGDYRRVWLLSALLEDYFVTRAMWFEGPKRALQWLTRHDTETYRAFEGALKPNATLDAIGSLVERVTSGNAGDASAA